MFNPRPIRTISNLVKSLLPAWKKTYDEEPVTDPETLKALEWATNRGHNVYYVHEDMEHQDEGNEDGTYEIYSHRSYTVFTKKDDNYYVWVLEYSNMNGFIRHYNPYEFPEHPKMRSLDSITSRDFLWEDVLLDVLHDLGVAV